MYDIGFIERYGSGIKMMKRLSKEWGNKAPRYEFHPLKPKSSLIRRFKRTLL